MESASDTTTETTDVTKPHKRHHPYAALFTVEARISILKNALSVAFGIILSGVIVSAIAGIVAVIMVIPAKIQESQMRHQCEVLNGFATRSYESGAGSYAQAVLNDTYEGAKELGGWQDLQRTKEGFSITFSPYKESENSNKYCNFTIQSKLKAIEKVFLTDSIDQSKFDDLIDDIEQDGVDKQFVNGAFLIDITKDPSGSLTITFSPNK